MIERHQDYLLTVPVVPPGGFPNVPLQLDSDAPFCLRRVKSRNIGLSGWRFQTPNKNWQSSALRTDWMVPQTPLASPFPGRGVRVYPQMIYPPNHQIVCDIGNDTGENILNAQLLFRGSKLFRDGAILAPTYPAQMSTLPFIYPVDVLGLGLASSATDPAIVKDVQLNIDFDADFVIRAMVCDPAPPVQVEGGIVAQGTTFRNSPGDDPVPPNYGELYAVMRDEARKAYSNAPIHINDLFGQGLPAGTVPATGAAGTDDEGTGPHFPGLVTPEIYVVRNASIYFDLFRFDTVGVPVDLRFRFMGAKVFHR